MKTTKRPVTCKTIFDPVPSFAPGLATGYRFVPSDEITAEGRQAAQWARDEAKARRRYQRAEAAREEAKRRQVDADYELRKADHKVSAALADWIELYQPSVAAILRGETKQQEPKQPTKNNRRTKDHG